ncbi:serine/threonine-protein kinase [Paraliomyxa miuraensis]|uniref:serine/threonine-protein kinase n=1 Tax=Paraliomyxa miuraensis TaxID=376150 RepID=UPI0022539774|nr:serine/threonine-protein kinase [Paraliomyxa miuraensis]MCX4247034.1 serine/threonine-protein kinase [Paraliomyxa miuraensis]
MSSTVEPTGEVTALGAEGVGGSHVLGRDRVIAEPVRGTSIGRYVVLDRLGVGGMGVVVRGFDPELDRKVALKLLRFFETTEGSEEAKTSTQSSLLREAQAMARVHHPNVVTVHDVGVHDGRVYVAMELVEGRTLRTWLAEQARPWPQVVDVLVQAGQGLHAAHQEHLVHRDFKPDNVMVSDRGRVVVMDFGLARGRDVSPVEPEEASPPSGAEPSSGERTHAGALVGTPAYMSPEQLDGREATARSDQFGFCVTMFEALYGERPFRADHAMALLLAITEGRIAPISTSTRVPAWLHRIVLRGLARKPEDRWPSMDVLLHALTHPPGQRRRRMLGRTAAGLGVVGSAMLAGVLARRPDDVCTGGSERLEGVWDAERRDELRSSMNALGQSWASTVAASVADDLDAYARDWAAMHDDACRATMVEGTQSSEAMDLRMACLEHARVELRAITERLASADLDVARNARAMLGSLRPLAGCADLAELRAAISMPTEPEARRELEWLQVELARIQATATAGKHAEAFDELERIQHGVDAIGYPPLRARYLRLRGNSEEALGRYDEARADTEEALSVAVIHGMHTETMACAQSLAHTIAEGQRRPAEALVYAKLAVALAERPDVPSGSALRSLLSMGLAQRTAGDLAAAEASQRRALELDPGDDPLLTRTAHNNLGNTLDDQGRYEEALAHKQRALELSIAALGADHPDQSLALDGVAGTLTNLLRYDEAEASLRRSLTLAEAAFGSRHPSIARSRFNLATVLASTGRLEAAETELKQALELIESSLGPDHPRAGTIHGNLARLTLLLDRPAEAEAHARRALSIVAAAMGPEHIELSMIRSQLAMCLEAQGRYAEAEIERIEALGMRESVLPADHPERLTNLVYLGRDLVELGRPDEAVPLLEQAIEGQARRSPPDPEVLADARFELARALWTREHERPRARNLAEQAIGEHPDATRRETMRAWLAR